jgi:signal peptidase II
MPKSFGSEKLGNCFLVAFLIILSDRFSKFFVVNSLELGESVSVLPFFNIVRVENRGITFGLLSGVSQPFFLVLISLILIVSLCVWGRNNKLYRFPICLIVSGAIGNMTDRIVYKAVIDFLDFHLLTLHWPAFNVADSAIVTGVLMLFFISYREEKS